MDADKPVFVDDEMDAEDEIALRQWLEPRVSICDDADSPVEFVMLGGESG